jgi:hypothetical protein
VEDRALADSGRQRDPLDRDVPRPVRRQEFLGGRQDRASARSGRAWLIGDFFR